MEDGLRQRVEIMVAAAERELALFDAQASGAPDPHRTANHDVPHDEARALAIAAFRQEFGAAPWPAALIDPGPGLVIAALNSAFAEAAGRNGEEIVGRSFFVLFPDNPANPDATGVAHLYASLRRAAESGRDDVMALQRYDTTDAQGVWHERYWLPVNHPVKDDTGRTLFIRHTSQEQVRPTP